MFEKLEKKTYYNLFYNKEQLFGALGEYYIGLPHSTTIYQRFSLSGGRQKELYKDNLQQRITSFHEMMHALQDMMTGFGAFHSKNIDQIITNICIAIRYLGLKNGHIKLPLNKWLRILGNEDRKVMEEMSDCNSFFYKNLNSIWQANKNGIGSLEIIEGSATFFSEIIKRYSLWTDFYEENNIYLPRYNFEDICSKVINLNPPYNTFIKEYLGLMKSFPVNISDRQKSDLLFIIHDIALDIPPPKIINKRLKMGVNTIEDFIPSCRYKKAFDAIITLNLEIPKVPTYPLIATETVYPIMREPGSVNEKAYWDQYKNANQEFGGNYDDKDEESYLYFSMKSTII